MCGRYTLTRAQRYAQERELQFGEFDIRPRYNIAPTQLVGVVFDESPRIVTTAPWGLIPHLAKDEKVGASLINARAKTVASKPAFRAAFKSRRCLVAAGFYKWQRAGPGKIPHRIVVGDGEPFSFAGLWESWRTLAGEPVRSCTIITCLPNAGTAPSHDRMPVILPRTAESQWLNPDTPSDALAALLVPHAPDAMRAYAVSSRVNTPRNDDPSLIKACNNCARCLSSVEPRPLPMTVRQLSHRAGGDDQSRTVGFGNREQRNRGRRLPHREPGDGSRVHQEAGTLREEFEGRHGLLRSMAGIREAQERVPFPKAGKVEVLP